MIIKSTVRGNGGKLANYLLNDKKNDRAELLELRGWAAENLKNALLISEEIAHGQTQCEKPFYHVSFRLAPGEELTPEQWERCADALEKRVGLEDHHRAMVMHTYHGEKHLHVVWDRIDENTLKAAELSFEHLQCKKTARALEKELGLQQVRDEKREPEKELAAPTREEEQQARRKGQDLQKLRAAIREAWEKSENGKSFAEALDERGFTLAQGEKRDYVAIDEQGSVYSIGKRTTGATAREVRAKLADLEREQIPSVEQAREELPARIAEREKQREYEAAQAEREQWEEKIAQAAIQKAEEEKKKERQAGQEAEQDKNKNAELGKAAAEIRLAVYLSKGGESFAAALGNRGYTLAQVSEQEAAAFERARAYAKEIGHYLPSAAANEVVAVNQFGGIHRLTERTTGKTREEFDKYLVQIKREELPTVTEAREDIEQKRAERAERQDKNKNAELGETAAEIRLAVYLSKGGESFKTALAERCLVLSQVSEQEAAAFERTAAFAEAIGHHAPRYNAGELVVINQFGGIHRLTARTTGKTREELDKYLVQIKRESLPNAEQGKQEAVMLGQYKKRAELLEKQAQQKATLEKQQAERKEQREKQAKEFEEKAKQDIDARLAGKHLSDKHLLERKLEENNTPLFGRLKERVKQFIGHKIDEHNAEKQKEKLHKAIIEKEWGNISGDESRVKRLDKSHDRAQATVEIKQAETREKMGIKAPERDEPLKAAQRTATATAFSKAAEQTTKPLDDGFPDPAKVRKADAEREKPAIQEREESGLDKTIRAVGKGREAVGKVNTEAKKSIRVLDKASGIATGVSNGAAAILDGIAKPVEAFAEFLGNMLGGASPAPPIHRREPGPTPAQIRDAERALTNINQSLKRGDDINAADLRNLPKKTLENIREGGDEYLMKMCQNWEIQQRERERENERER